jgi:hypothetical protein
MRKRQAMLNDVGTDRLWRFFDIDAQDYEPLILVALIECFESGPLSQTMGSPGGPKVYEHHLSFE